MPECPICKEYYFAEKHHCPPFFYYKHEDYGDNFQEIRAYNFEDAAERFATLYNEDDGEYCLMGNDDGEEVIISDGKIEKTFTVFAEQSIAYSVKEKEASQWKSFA